MVVTLDTVVVGKEEKVSQKGNKYGIACFMDGATPVRAMVKDLGLLSKIEEHEKAEVLLNIDFKYTKVEVVAWEKKTA